MEKIMQILSSPVFWSTGIAFWGVVLGGKIYLEKIKKEDEAIKAKRREEQSSQE